MTPLRQKMIDAMLVRGFSVRTQRSYLDAVIHLSRHYQCSPEPLSNAQLQDYFLYLVKERHLSPASCRLSFNGIRFLYLNVLAWPAVDLSVALPKAKQRIPELLSRDEVARLLAAVANRKHRMLLATCYGCGLRVSELVALRVGDIDGERRLLRVTQAKAARTGRCCCRRRCCSGCAVTGASFIPARCSSTGAVR